ncbi:MAG: DnaA ATPase domain-containing protein [Desulfovibrio sp.]
MKNSLRQDLLKKYSEEEIKRWFDPLQLTFSQSPNTVSVRFPHTFFAQWFTDEIKSEFEEALVAFIDGEFTVDYAVGNLKTHKQETVVKTISKPRIKSENPFGQQFTFDEFLVNRKNFFPLASAREVAREDRVVYNPFVICGENGSGKTHLLRAIANELTKKNSSLKIIAVSVDELTNIYKVQFGNDVFKARNYIFEHDALFVDDLAKLRRDPQLQQELVVLFNHFYDNKKQMVFCGEGKVSAYEFLHPALKSRLEWGLIVSVKKPDLPIRVEFIQANCQKRSMPLSREQILTLAQKFEDFRYLQGILLKLFAFRELVKQDISDRDFEKILQNTEEKATETLTPDTVMQIVAKDFGIHVRELIGSKRHQKISQCRQVAMYLCRDMLGISYPALGRVFGGKDHSTVLYAVKKIDKLQKVDRDMNRLLKALKEKCHQQDP